MGAVKQGGQVVELFAGEGRKEGSLARVQLFGKDALQLQGLNGLQRRQFWTNDQEKCHTLGKKCLFYHSKLPNV